MLKFKAALTFAIIIFLAKELQAQTSIIGRVYDQDGITALGGVTISAPDIKSRTYSSASGFFRINAKGKEQNVIFYSIGYERLSVKLKPGLDTISIKLKPNSIRKGEVAAIGFMSVEQIIERTIKRKKENISKIKTLQGSLYSKFSLELDGKGMGMGFGGNSASLGSGELEDKYKMFILESFSYEWRDLEKNKIRNDIINRRQTANIKPDDNLLTMSNFISFYDDVIELVNAKLNSPIADDALTNYNFTLLDRETYGDKYVYSIEVKPKSDLFPGFYGNIKIIEETYDLIHIDLKPSQNTAIAFVDNLRIVQKFDEIKEGLWYPTYVSSSGKARVEVVKGFMEMKLALNVVGIYSDIKANEEIADTVFKDKNYVKTVSPKADSSSKEFWDNNSQREITEKEKTMYSVIDSAVAKSKDSSAKKSSFNFDYSPYLAFNRAEAFKIGASGTFSYGSASLTAKPFFSTKDQKVFSYASIDYAFKIDSVMPINLSLSGFDMYSEQYFYKRSLELFNSVSSLFFNSDDYNYYKIKGVNAGLSTNLLGIGIGLNYTNTSQKSDTTIQKKINYLNNCVRANPKIEDGDYQTIGLSLSYGNYDFSGLSQNFGYHFSSNLVYGKQKSDKFDKDFKSGDFKFYCSIPTIETGYSPIMFRFALGYGISDKNTPAHYLTMPQTKGLIFATYDDFYTIPHSTFAGGEKFTINAEINFTDILWRAIGLPLYEKRGIEFIGTGGAFKMIGSSALINPYITSDGNWKYEIGLGLGKIPLFFSNVLFLRIDVRAPINSTSNQKIGFGINYSAPF